MDVEQNLTEKSLQINESKLDLKKKNNSLDDFENEFLQLMSDQSSDKPRTLADLIAKKIIEKREELQDQFNFSSEKKIDQEVYDLYKDVGIVLSKYTSGKLPKAFKMIPSLENWEQILRITKPEKWSSAAVYEATKLFTAMLKENQAQRFNTLILLPRLRDDILSGKKLNVYIYKSLQKCLFKPGAFFKGIVLPLCSGKDCTHREASIVGSILVKKSIPLLYSCAAMIKLAEMHYTGATSLFLNVLIQKKYALPFRVIDALVYHFIRMSADSRKLPILWHKCFLGFVEFYKKDISDEQKESLLMTMSSQWNNTYSPLIKKHLKELVDQEFQDQEFTEQNKNFNQLQNENFDEEFNYDYPKDTKMEIS